MLLRSAVQKNPSAIAHTQDENDTKNRRSSNFLGRKTTVLVKAGSSSQIFKAETAVNQHKRHISSTESLSEASAVLLKDRFRVVVDRYSNYSLNKDFSRLIAQNINDREQPGHDFGWAQRHCMGTAGQRIMGLSACVFYRLGVMSKIQC